MRSSQSGAVAEGLGFAIPTNTARAVAEQIMQKGYFSRPYLGIRWQVASPPTSPPAITCPSMGRVRHRRVAGSPADQAGLQRGDIITHIGDTSLDESTSFLNVLYTYQPGDEVTLTVMRGRSEETFTITLGETTQQ